MRQWIIGISAGFQIESRNSPNFRDITDSIRNPLHCIIWLLIFRNTHEQVRFMLSKPMEYIETWLFPRPEDFPLPTSPEEAAQEEAELLRRRFPQARVRFFQEDLGEGYHIEITTEGAIIHGQGAGLLYGIHRLARQWALEGAPSSVSSAPKYALRMLNHWDNMDGTVERGYAGRSLFFEDNAFAWDEKRMHAYGRMLASVGINVISLNNVNVHPPAQHLLDDLLPEVKRLADLFRVYGVRLLLTVDFGAPVFDGLSTADPLVPDVAAWWEKRVQRVYEAIPDLAGFLVKADSEFRGGPHSYGRTHADGANMLAKALAPYGGVVVWRCFVYNCQQDWRDGTVDRPCAAYDHFIGLDGSFESNVMLQIKNGPVDFQVREPVSPLLLALKNTSMAMEVQLAQEYTGQQIDLYYMQEVWQEIFEVLSLSRLDAICAVSNLGRDKNWTGHDLATANLYAYGRMAWDPAALTEDLALEWARLTLGADSPAAETVADMLRRSRGIYQRYTAPLGLGWMVRLHTHYGPSPEGYEYDKWGTYLRADRNAVGVDRTAKGTGFTKQYPPRLRALYEDPNACPETLLLFFHRLPYDFPMKDGRTLIQRIYDDHFQGAEEAEALLVSWEGIRPYIPPEMYLRVQERLLRQVENAREWRDVINTYFHRYSGVEDSRKRKIFP